MRISKIRVEVYELKHPEHPYGEGIYDGGWTVGSFMPYHNEIKVYGTIYYTDGSSDSGVELLRPGYITLECNIVVDNPHITMKVNEISDNKIHGVVMDKKVEDINNFKTGLEGLTINEMEKIFPKITTTATYVLKVKPDPKVVGKLSYRKEFPIRILRYGEAVASAMWIGYFNRLREIATKHNLTDDEKVLVDSISYTDPDTGFILTPRTPEWVVLNFIKEKYGNSSSLFLNNITSSDNRKR